MPRERSECIGYHPDIICGSELFCGRAPACPVSEANALGIARDRFVGGVPPPRLYFTVSPESEE